MADTKQFLLFVLFQVNGFSNSYWGWGGEDNDTNQRIKKKGFCVQRPHYDTCR